MASDDLRARIAEALDECRTLIPTAQADAVMAIVQPELDRRDKRIEDYRESRRRWMDAAYADRRASNAIGEQLNAALAALQAVREAQSLGEALAAVAKHDGLTTQPTTKETER